MKLFRLIRLGAWSCLLAVCLLVFLCNYCLQRTIISPDGLRIIADQSHAYQVVRDYVIAPYIVQQAAESPFGHLATDTVIKNALAKSLTEEQMKQLSPPIIDGTYRWLDSKEPRISFSIDATQANARFGEALAAEITAALAQQPACTNTQTFTDALNGVCNSPFLSDRQRETIIHEATTAATNTLPATVTDKTIPFPLPLATRTSDLPSLLNLVYALHLIASALGVMGILWLLLKWRLRGIIAIGSIALLTAIGIGIVTVTLTTIAKQLIEAPYQSIASALVAAFNQQLASFVPLLVLSGVGIVALGTFGIIAWKKHQKRAPSSPIEPPTEPPLSTL